MITDLGDIWEVKPIRRLYSEHVRIINDICIYFCIFFYIFRTFLDTILCIKAGTYSVTYNSAKFNSNFTLLTLYFIYFLVLYLTKF